ncbi:unnamed protein product [Scytosiphon promiscuus]
MEGCMIEGDFISGTEVEFFGASGFIASYLATDGQYYWGAFQDAGTGSYSQVCGTSEVATLVHPSEATWICDPLSHLPDLDEHTPHAGVECGCDDTTTTASDATPATTPTPVAAPTAPSGGGSCADGDSVSVSSSLEPILEGCYLSTNVEFNDQLVYSKTGETFGGEVWVVALPISEDVGAEVYWWLAFVPTTTSSSAGVETEIFCLSFEEAAVTHPGDVTAWFCEFETFACGGRRKGCGTSEGDVEGASKTPLAERSPACLGLPRSSVVRSENDAICCRNSSARLGEILVHPLECRAQPHPTPFSTYWLRLNRSHLPSSRWQLHRSLLPSLLSR